MRGTYNVKINTTVLDFTIARCMFQRRKSPSGEDVTKHQKEDSAVFKYIS